MVTESSTRRVVLRSTPEEVRRRPLQSRRDKSSEAPLPTLSNRPGESAGVGSLSLVTVPSGSAGWCVRLERVRPFGTSLVVTGVRSALSSAPPGRRRGAQRYSMPLRDNARVRLTILPAGLQNRCRGIAVGSATFEPVDLDRPVEAD
jgi:hypothetical protein